MPDYLDTHVDEAQLLTYQGADFDEVCLVGRLGAPGRQVWCWTRRQEDLAKACWLRLMVTVDDEDSAAAVERVRAALLPRPVSDPARPVWQH